MSCPSSQELKDLLAPGEPKDPARASAVIAHVRECPHCREALQEDIASLLPSPVAGKKKKGPSNVVVGLVGLGLGLLVFSRVGMRSLVRPRGDGGAAVVSSSR
ncbi:hypothetical protein HY251_03520 [bacterium]|nr:hypothetical protein [bacterium]